MNPCRCGHPVDQHAGVVELVSFGNDRPIPVGGYGPCSDCDCTSFHMQTRLPTLGDHATATSMLTAYGTHAHDLYADEAGRLAATVIAEHARMPYDDRANLQRLEAFDRLVAQAKRRAS